MPLAFEVKMRNNHTMPRNANALETRLHRVEQELAQLKATRAPQPGKRWYREIVGSYAGDRTLAEIVRLGRLIRRGKLKSYSPLPALPGSRHL
jgi:hypothetical protein